jgi:hypothetical protein
VQQFASASSGRDDAQCTLAAKLPQLGFVDIPGRDVYLAATIATGYWVMFNMASQHLSCETKDGGRLTTSSNLFIRFA